MGTIISDDLPEDILDAILSRLPLRDAARAGAVNAAWARAWRHLSDLDLAWLPRPAIDAVLRQHAAGHLVRRARFMVGDDELPGVDGWTTTLLLLSHPHQSGPTLQSLDLSFGMCIRFRKPLYYPAFFFFPAFTRLRDLALSCCALPHAPLTFAGFPNLATLSLIQVTVQKGADLEAIISLSPELETLVVADTNVAATDTDDALARHGLRMASASLRCLEIAGQRNIEWVAASLPRMAHVEFADARPDSVAALLQGMADSVEYIYVT